MNFGDGINGSKIYVASTSILIYDKLRLPYFLPNFTINIINSIRLDNQNTFVANYITVINIKRKM